MNNAALLARIEKERLELAAFLETLDAADWRRESLCDGWSVHDVLAHLTLSTHETFLQFLMSMLRARGDMDKAFFQSAQRRAQEFSPTQLIEQLRETAGSRKHLIGSTPVDRLMDVVVHGQDIAVALGRSHRFPVESATPMLDRAWGSAFYGGKKRFPSSRLVATDAAWSAGAGTQELRGQARDLLLKMLGRDVPVGEEDRSFPPE
jgi:uncharacterized protein (TIGR03083 family)